MFTKLNRGVSMRRILQNLCLTASLLLSGAAYAGDSIQDWNAAKAPPVPEVKSVKLDPKTTALLVLDLVKQTCSQERRPRCLDTLKSSHDLLVKVRAAHALVVYSTTAISTMADVLPDVAALPDEPHVQATPDKFLNTDLDAILKSHGIKTVIVIGTAAHGAVLNTAAQAALRGYQVVYAEDGVSGDNPYIEQAVIDVMLTGPTLSTRTTLSRSDLIGF
ncbi:MAG: isochorismatase family protein [Acetobacteraceae bacterium]|nr:isochorismatase family protein [Acetobacteraceae bacterium]